MTRSLFAALLMLLSLTLPFMASAAEGGGGKVDPAYVPLNPPFVVNLQNGNQMTFMQVKVQVLSHESAVRDALKAQDPAIRDAMIMLLTQQTAAAMHTVQGREKLRQEAKKAIQQVLAQNAGLKKGVEEVYFTGFVIQ